MSSRVSSECEHLMEHGFVVLKSIISPKECARFYQDVVIPSLFSVAGIQEDEQNTWTTKKVINMATGEYDEAKHGSNVPGVMVRRDDNSDPIAPPEGRWSSVFGNEHLLSFLDHYHDAVANKYQGSRKWQWLNGDNVGWIHVRFPWAHQDSNISVKNHAWHVDGGHFDPHRLDSEEQSVIILPMVREVEQLGGNTVVLIGSHKKIEDALREAGAKGITYRDLFSLSQSIAESWPDDKVKEIAPCQPGDVLVLHPLAVHAAGFNNRDHLRITFNIGTRWKPFH